MPPFPSLTKTWHSKPYAAIEPARPELSAKGKVVAITGAGGSIGAATALAFAKAGATKLALIGRRAGPLQQTKDEIRRVVPGVKALVIQGDISKAASVRSAFKRAYEELGSIDILIANAGYLPHFESVTEADEDEWWRGFEVNTRGAFNLARALLPVASEKVLVLEVSTCVVHMPAMASASGYVASKLASTKIWETFAAEHADKVSVISIHPGVIYSELNVKSGIAAQDDAELPANFMVWAASPEGNFLRGKYLWVNWDVDELKSRKEELSRPDQLTITMNGWPFGEGSDNAANSLKF